MGTNYYRIPTIDEVNKKEESLVEQIKTMKLTPENIKNEFRLESFNPWQMFMEGMNIHLGKRSMGWKFCWDFHDNEYYSNKEELIKFVKSGRVVNEYGEEIDVDEFLEMAFNWGEPDGLIVDEEYYKNNEPSSYFNNPKYYDRIIDGLRVSTSTDFF